MRSIDEIVADALTLHALWKAGRLGGETMPEDAHPGASSEALAAYFTLGMCLNYQRNSYALWRACTALHDDPASAWALNPAAAAQAPLAELAGALLRHRVALQPNRHPMIWRRNALGIVRHGGGSVRALFAAQAFDLAAVRAFVSARKADFPYLGGPKIANYWLYVMSSYLDWPFAGRAALTVAPDRHVIGASVRLGLVEAGDTRPELIAGRWAEVLARTSLAPIDLHTPLWLWGRAGFPAIDAISGGALAAD